MIEHLRSCGRPWRTGREGLDPGGLSPVRLPRRIALPLLILVLTAFQGPSGARASFFDTFGADARGMALGGAMAAISRGWASVYYNPAALALSRDVEFSVGLFAANPSIKVDLAQGAEEDLTQLPRRPGSLDSIAGPAIGLVLPVQRLTPKRLPMPWAVGIGLFVPRQALATTRVIDQTFPFDVVFQERNATMALHFGVSTRITSALYLGVGLASQMVTPVDVQFSETADSPAELTVRFGAPSVLAGILLRPSERLRLGIVYRQENKVRSRWTAFVQARVPISIGGSLETPFSFYREGTIEREYISAYAPETVSFGGAYKVTERFRVSAELTWYRWSGYPGPLGRRLEFEFNDILVPRVGALYRITRRLEARAGIYYEPTPVTNQSTGFYPIGNDRVVPSVGLGYTFPAPWGILAKPVSVDAYFQYHFLMEEEFNRAIPPNPFARNPDLTSSGSVLNAGIELTFRF